MTTAGAVAERGDEHRVLGADPVHVGGERDHERSDEDYRVPGRELGSQMVTQRTIDRRFTLLYPVCELRQLGIVLTWTLRAGIVNFWRVDTQHANRKRNLRRVAVGNLGELFSAEGIQLKARRIPKQIDLSHGYFSSTRLKISTGSMVFGNSKPNTFA